MPCQVVELDLIPPGLHSCPETHKLGAFIVKVVGRLTGRDIHTICPYVIHDKLMAAFVLGSMQSHVTTRNCVFQYSFKLSTLQFSLIIISQRIVFTWQC